MNDILFLFTIIPQHIGVQVDSVDHVPFEPQELTADGSVSLLEFALFLCQQVLI